MAITDKQQVLALAERMKAEIQADLIAQRIPLGIRDFGELHDHVDANMYGEALHPPVPDGNDDDSFSKWMQCVANPAQQLVHEYLDSEVWIAVEEAYLLQTARTLCEGGAEHHCRTCKQKFKIHEFHLLAQHEKERQSIPEIKLADVLGGMIYCRGCL